MRRARVPVLVGISILGLIVAGIVVYESGNHGLGGVLLVLAVIGIGLVIAPALGSQGRGAEQQGMLGRRSDVGGFDRPHDQSGL
jgi:hypothetical protein